MWNVRSPADTRSLNGAEGDIVGGGSGRVTGTYGSEVIAPIMAAYWVGHFYVYVAVILAAAALTALRMRNTQTLGLIEDS